MYKSSWFIWEDKKIIDFEAGRLYLQFARFFVEKQKKSSKWSKIDLRKGPEFRISVKRRIQVLKIGCNRIMGLKMRFIKMTVFLREKATFFSR